MFIAVSDNYSSYITKKFIATPRNLATVTSSQADASLGLFNTDNALLSQYLKMNVELFHDLPCSSVVILQLKTIQNYMHTSVNLALFCYRVATFRSFGPSSGTTLINVVVGSVKFTIVY
jgi:hypothetical protein